MNNKDILKNSNNGSDESKEIFLNNMEEYEDPDLYDSENEMYKDDLGLILEWAEKTKGKIIELACGTGRIALELAERGMEVVGVDLNKQMLKKAEEKAKGRNLYVQWILQDCTELNLNIKSTFIYMVGNSFQHFLTNESQDKLFESVSNYLDINGIFIFDTRFPSLEELLQPEKEEYWKSYIDEKNRKVDLYTLSSYDALNQIQHYKTIRIYNEDTFKEKSQETNISLRYVYPQEMRRVLQQYGFEILNIYGYWDKRELTPKSSSMIVVCKKV
ncbi:Methyltransferase domain-containing protein [Clostridium amylolyticum]|uniref:Methyltransferase domain-containing protein n=1 Tax=Clostridium amylolyticum TaxID=1121298 RepID=A0A1M6LM68_9CLOT|nr:class I SAM-dependent methyltransferase [Clostridium amylolyticum]SHJ72306.1 Methyltransferase domain-containing protein [Clostridium amylolyticum]